MFAFANREAAPPGACLPGRLDAATLQAQSGEPGQGGIFALALPVAETSNPTPSRMNHHKPTQIIYESKSGT
jgi:hypothetical protein